MNMVNQPSLFFITSFLLLLWLSLASSPWHFPPAYHDDEASALLQFKQSLSTNMCGGPSDYPKLESWKILHGERSNCCSWDGVECDIDTGHVISLELGRSCLDGSLSFNTSLSKLSKLGHLNLAYNNFRDSSVPSMSGAFPHLTYLNISYSQLSGSIPSSISHLSKLSTLDISSDHDGLMLEGHTFDALVENLTRLEHLHLGYVGISSTIPKTMLNLSSLVSLSLPYCGLHGEFPAEVLKFHNLKHIELSDNIDLVGFLPQFNYSSPLEDLTLGETGFSGSLPVSIGNLHSLKKLDLWSCSFSGQLPKSLQKLTQLSFFDLSFNNFENVDAFSLSWLGNRTKLTFLGFPFISLPGEIPSYLANLTQLRYISLRSCHLTGPLPSGFFNMSQLQKIDLSYNDLQGPIPNLFSRLTQLSHLSLADNNFSGEVDFDMFLELKMLTNIFLSGNNLSLVHVGNRNVTADRFIELGLGSCNLKQFPYFLHDQNQLTWLDLSHNSIHNWVPQWIWNVSKDTLEIVDLSYNFLTGLELEPNVLPWSQMIWILLSNNMFQGPLPLPPASTVEFSVDGNNFTGEISEKFCSLSSLSTLDLSYNNLSGQVPRCLANSSASLEVLSLGGNNLHGSIPQTPAKLCNLKVFTLEGNSFNGRLPRSLSNCRSLEFLNFAENQIQDTFPSWLGPLEQLGVLIVRSNNMYGELKGSKMSNQFPKLRIIDVSSNNFSGPLPAQYFIGWNAMKIKANTTAYLESNRSFSGDESVGDHVSSNYLMYMVLTSKGTERNYEKIIESLVAIDFSGNRFEGHVPINIGSLSGLRLLNLSNNILTGAVPSSLANLSDLEALDLSRNNLSGEIPQELASLTFLSFFNVSNNNLTGSIPRGNQFDVFQNDSYLGNPALCGHPLSKQCGTPPSTSEDDDPDDDDDDDDGSLLHFGWKPVAIGYASGFPLGIGLGYLVYTRKYPWILKIFGEKRRWRNVVRGAGQWDTRR